MNPVGIGLGIQDSLSFRATLGILLDTTLDTTGGEVSDSPSTEFREKLASLLNGIRRGMEPAQLEREFAEWARKTHRLSLFATTESLMAQVRERLTPEKKLRIVVQPMRESESDLTPRVTLALERMMERLWALRIYRGIGGPDEGRWFEKILRSRILDSPPNPFRFQTLHREGASLTASWVLDKEGKLIPEIYFREDLPLDEKDLAFVLLSAFKKNPTRPKIARRQEGVAIGGLDFVRNTMDPKRCPPFIPMAIEVQKRLIAEGSPWRFTVGRIPPDKDPMLPQFLRDHFIFHLQLPEKELAALTEDKLMDWLKKATSKPMKRRFVPLGALGETLSFRINDEARTPSHPKIPRAWVREFLDLFRWIKKLAEKPNPLDINTAIFQVDFVPSPSPHRKNFLFRIANSIHGSHVRVYGPYEELVEWPPLKWLAILLFAEQSAGHTTIGDGFRRESLSRLTTSEILFRMQMSRQWAQNWVWVQLFWDYKKFLAAKVASKKQEPHKLYMRGKAWEKDQEAQRALMQAILNLQRREERLVTDSVAARPNWFLEYPMDSTDSQGEPRLPSTVTKISVWVTGTARLIHFDAKPEFNNEEWEKIAELILKAPEGLTWVEPAYGWKSNRPELLVKEGDEAWYEQNPKYKSATLRIEKERYKQALTLIGELAQRINLEPPHPTSSSKEITYLKRKIVPAYHPDTRTLKISTEEFKQMIEAFSVLSEFHQ